jgi:hypothetical protein
MRFGRRGVIAMAMTLGLMVAAFSVPAAASGPAAPAGTEPATGAFLFQGSKAKGLVTLTQVGSTATLRFHLFGLRPDRQYRLIGSTKGCPSTGGIQFKRSFKTNGRGVAWDPVTYTMDATKTRSVRIMNAATGAKVACVGTPEFTPTTDARVTKMRTPTIRGLVVERTSSVTGDKTIAAAFTGLAANGEYVLSGRVGTCETPVANVWVTTVSANAAGSRLELTYTTTGSQTATIVQLLDPDAVELTDPAIVCRQIRPV